jgi:hypothetical protein
LKGSWVPHDTRDEVVDFVNRWTEKTEIAIRVLVLWLGISLSKFYDVVPLVPSRLVARRQNPKRLVESLGRRGGTRPSSPPP